MLCGEEIKRNGPVRSVPSASADGLTENEMLLPVCDGYVFGSDWSASVLACLQRDPEPRPGKREACAPVGEPKFRGGVSLTLNGVGERRTGVGDLPT